MIVAMRTESLVITNEILTLIAELDEFKGTWRALGRLAPERLSRLRKVATIESVGSSTRIEGVRLSDRQVEELLGRIQAESFATRDEQEVAGYALVMDTIFTNHDAIPITENYIKQLHTMLLRYSGKDIRHRGHYKAISNQVEAFDTDGASLGVVFQTATPFDTPREMQELLAWFKECGESGILHPLLTTAIFIVVFLAIHPFQDGNGRLSRALTTLLLLKAGYAYVPYSSLESIIEQNKESYYLALRRTQGTLRAESPEWLPWIVFFLRALQKQKVRLQAKVESEKIMGTAMPQLAMDILDLAIQHGQVSVAEIMRVTNAPRGTVKKRLLELTEAGHIKPIGKGRATRYVPV